MPVRIKLEAFDFQKYGMVQGKVCFISPDAKVVEGQRVAKYVVKIELDGREVDAARRRATGSSSAWRARRKSSLTGKACCRCCSNEFASPSAWTGARESKPQEMAGASKNVCRR